MGGHKNSYSVVVKYCYPAAPPIHCHTDLCYQLYEVRRLDTDARTLQAFQSTVLQASHVAGINSRPTVLYIHRYLFYSTFTATATNNSIITPTLS